MPGSVGTAGSPVNDSRRLPAAPGEEWRFLAIRGFPWGMAAVPGDTAFRGDVLFSGGSGYSVRCGGGDARVPEGHAVPGMQISSFAGMTKAGGPPAFPGAAPHLEAVQLPARAGQASMASSSSNPKVDMSRMREG